jgi:hypothetical protein
LKLYCCGFGNAESRDLVSKGLIANQSLESLTIELEEDDPDLVEPVLLRLGSHPRLRELNLDCGDALQSLEHADALALFLRSSTTLEHLKLASYVFVKGLLEPLVEGIQSSKSLAKLTIFNCTFDLESTRLFQSILELQNSENQNSIRKLVIGHANTFASPIGQVVVNMLRPEEEQEAATKKVVSLEELDMTGDMNGVVPFRSADFVEICGALGANSADIQLQQFRYGRIDNEGCEALTACLPKLLYLKALSIRDIAQHVTLSKMKELIGGLRRNGSLNDVDIVRRADGYGQQVRFFTEDQLRRVQFYCKRNETRPALVANPRLGDSEEEDSDETDISMFPTIFGLAQQAPRTAPTHMLLGLLSLGDVAGQRSDGKRLRNEPATAAFSEN